MSNQGENTSTVPVIQSPDVPSRTFQLTERWFIYGGLYIAVVVGSCALGLRNVPILLTGPLGLVAALFCLYVVYGLLMNLVPAGEVSAAQSGDYPTWFAIADRLGWCLVFGIVAFINDAVLFLIVSGFKSLRSSRARS
jgi:hypothetical protein